MYLPRLIDRELESWRLSVQRKPLMLRGARQVGKSSAVRHFSKQFKYFIEINFEEQPRYKAVFEQFSDVRDICEWIAAATNTPVVAGETLLFFDEIQSCLPAIGTLRYFYEKLPDMHVIAAGSLLEFALAELPSFGVGRIRSMFMYPFCFEEFLMAYNEYLLLEALEKSNPDTPLPDVIHDRLKHYLKRFLIVGGMPEAVHSYVVKNDILETQRVLDDLIISLESDFAKYKHRMATTRVREVFNAVIYQLGSKFTYNYPNVSLNNAQIKEVLELLRMAGLIYPVTHTAANGIPIGAEINPKFRKYLILDTGIAQRIQGLSVSDLILTDDVTAINKGAIAELHVGLELLKSQSPYQIGALYYWQNLTKGGQAELDYVVQQQTEIIPIEVKAGTKGSMQSMYLFMKSKNLTKGMRFSLENFSSLNGVVVCPLYAVQKMLKN